MIFNNMAREYYKGKNSNESSCIGLIINKWTIITLLGLMFYLSKKSPGPVPVGYYPAPTPQQVENQLDFSQVKSIYGDILGFPNSKLRQIPFDPDACNEVPFPPRPPENYKYPPLSETNVQIMNLDDDQIQGAPLKSTTQLQFILYDTSVIPPGAYLGIEVRVLGDREAIAVDGRVNLSQARIACSQLSLIANGERLNPPLDIGFKTPLSERWLEIINR